ncbi:Magnesium transporter CorA [Sphingomonas antarctica]|uniref:zinc transporter ZntB n=1 Tax=Sphingomonas antarctica TaxID=2040274 RepID=UPI0039ED2BBF
MGERCWVFDGKAAKKVSRDEAAAALGTAPLVWVHLPGSHADTGDWLKAQGLSEIIVSALTAMETRPRTEPFDDGALVNLRGPVTRETDHPDVLGSVRLWVSDKRVFSVALTDLEATHEVERQLGEGKILDAGDLVCVMATAITAELDPDVAELGDSLDDCEEMLDPKRAFAMRADIARIRSRAIVYRRFLQPQRVALEELAEIQGDWLAEDDRRHLTEAADRAARMAEELEAIRERSALMHEQLTDLRAELIDTRSLILAIAAMIFLPLTFITGLFGMNVDGIPYQHHPASFWVITVFCMLVAVGVTVYFVWRRWSR